MNKGKILHFKAPHKKTDKTDKTEKSHHDEGIRVQELIRIQILDLIFHIGIKPCDIQPSKRFKKYEYVLGQTCPDCEEIHSVDLPILGLSGIDPCFITCTDYVHMVLPWINRYCQAIHGNDFFM